MHRKCLLGTVNCKFGKSGDYTHAMYVTNTTWKLVDTVKFYEKLGNCENYIKETKYDMNIGSLKMKSFWANEAFFQLMMLVYNIFLLFKMDRVSISEYRQWILTFRLKYVFVAALFVKIVVAFFSKILFYTILPHLFHGPLDSKLPYGCVVTA